MRTLGRFLVRALIVAVIMAVGAAFALRAFDQPFRGYTGPEVFVDIPQGTGVAAIGHRLVQAGVIKHDWAFRYAVWRRGAARTHRRRGRRRREGNRFRDGRFIDRLGPAHFRTALLGQ